MLTKDFIDGYIADRKTVAREAQEALARKYALRIRYGDLEENRSPAHHLFFTEIDGGDAIGSAAPCFECGCPIVSMVRCSGCGEWVCEKHHKPIDKASVQMTARDMEFI